MAQKIRISWSYPKTWKAALSSIEATGNGIYQITRLFGDADTLLYIGLVKGSSRDFRTRMHEHRRDWLYKKRGEIFLRFGLVQAIGKFVVDGNLIEEIEGALIYEIEPPENTSKVRSYSIRKDLIIMSTGYRGEVPDEVDTSSH